MRSTLMAAMFDDDPGVMFSAHMVAMLSTLMAAMPFGYTQTADASDATKLLGLVGPDDTFRVSYRTAAKALGLSFHGAREMFHSLEREGWIEQTNPGQRSSLPTAYRWLE